MHPVLFSVFKFPIHSYGLMLAISFLFGIWLSGLIAKKRGLDPVVISDVGFWLILSAIVGSRVYYVILHFEEFQGNLASIFNPFHGGNFGIGGLVMYGGFIGALLASFIFFRIKKLSMLDYADAMSASVGFGIFFTRIGCFLNGCCYGSPTTQPIGIAFPIESPAGYYQHHLHASALNPSQLYESAAGLLMGVIILSIGRWRPFAGFHFFLTGLMYAVVRFFVDFSRYYSSSERIGSLSHNQIVCIVFFVLFSGLILKNIIARSTPVQA